jgi:hypothetical protein
MATIASIGPYKGPALTPRFSCTATVTPASVAATTVSAQTVTIAGLTTDMLVVVNPPAPTVNACLCSANVSAANTLNLNYVNPTSGAVTPDSGTYYILAV